MTYYNSARSKNFIIFTDDDNKTYTLDVNTGIFTNNQTNKPIKRFPTSFGRYLDGYNGGDAVISMMRHIRNNPRHYGVTIDGYVLTTLTGFITAAKYLNFADRVQNVGGVFADRKTSRSLRDTAARMRVQVLMLFSALAVRKCSPQSIRWKKSIICRRKRLIISTSIIPVRKILPCGSSISPALATT